MTRAHVVHISAECWPFARTGGLGEAVAGLVATQRREGIEAWVVVPLYRTVRAFLANRGCELEAVGGPLTLAVGNEAGVVVRLMRVRRETVRAGGHT
ncbi:MAG: glycogen/starch synthase, partial [Rhodospirillaceae bacterium]|nr:glycogen/starch synthase [Rhodospirillaceae bacterium]